jgi:tetratricopeptide (TPR) repeat protein
MYRVVSAVILVSYWLLGASVGWSEQRQALRLIIVQERATAEDILQQIRRGASFSAMAHAKSAGPERNTWGYIGTVAVDDMQRELQPVVRQLQVGQISEVFAFGSQFAIVKAISPQIEQYSQEADQALRANQQAQAVRALRAALRLEEDNVQMYLRLGMLHHQAKQYDEAIRYLEQAQQYAPEESQILLLLGAACTHAATETKNQARAQQALRTYEQVLRLNPQLAPASYFGMGKVYLLALQQPQKAIAPLEQAVQMNPRVPEVYRLLIQAYTDARQYDKARQSLQLAQRLGYNFPELNTALQKGQRAKQR